MSIMPKSVERRGDNSNGLDISLPGSSKTYQLHGPWLMLVGTAIIAVAVIWPLCWAYVSKISYEHGGGFVAC